MNVDAYGATRKAMEALGWEWLQVAADDADWVKFDTEGSPLGKGGDALWKSDFKACWAEACKGCMANPQCYGDD